MPLLVTEIDLLGAAVTNLESYEGHEAILCTGYALLATLEGRQRNLRPVNLVHGILAFVHENSGTVSESPSAEIGDGGPELVS